MSEQLIRRHPGNQAITATTLLTDLAAAGWCLVKVSQVKLDGKEFDFETQREALEIIQGMDIALLEFAKAERTNQHIRLDYSGCVGREMLSDWSRLPEFNSLIEQFLASIHSHLLMGFLDTQLTMEQIRVKYEVRGEHSHFRKSAWQSEVANADTLRGYWEWVHAKVEESAGDGVAA